jgi:hypothetical protein
VRDLLFPRTDQGVAVQLLWVTLVASVVLVLVRRERALVTFTIGVTMVVLGLMGVRALH